MILSGPQRSASDIQEASIRALYPRMERAYEAKNWRAIDRAMTRDFVNETPDHKKVGRAALLKSQRQAFASFNKLKVEIDPLSVVVNGRRATVECRYSLSGRFNDKRGAHSIKVEGSEADIFRKVGGRWLLAYIREHDSSTMVDGRVVEHSP